jgi:hypothetical protein
MKRIEKDELYENLAQFLQQKGVKLTEGSYAQTLHKSCRMLADIINLSQQGLERAKTGIDTKLEQVREVIHQKTAPKDRATPPGPEPANAAPPAPEVKTADEPAKPKSARPAAKGSARKPARPPRKNAGKRTRPPSKP